MNSNARDSQVLVAADFPQRQPVNSVLTHHADRGAPNRRSSQLILQDGRDAQRGLPADAFQ
ncbi:MAG: hypothetical protein ACLQCB_10390, partial [Spirochaetia bacterium]